MGADAPRVYARSDHDAGGLHSRGERPQAQGAECLPDADGGRADGFQTDAVIVLLCVDCVAKESDVMQSTRCSRAGARSQGPRDIYYITLSWSAAAKDLWLSKDTKRCVIAQKCCGLHIQLFTHLDCRICA